MPHLLHPYKSALLSGQTAVIVSGLRGAASLPSHLTLSRAGNAMLFNSTGNLTWAPANLCPYSQTESDASWSASATTKTSTDNPDPFGTNTALLLTANGASAQHFVAAASPNLISYVAGNTYMFSGYAKAGSTSLLQHTFPSAVFGAGQYANFSLTGNGSVTAVTGGNASISLIGDGWYRISFSAVCTTTGTNSAGALAFINSSTAARLPTYVSSETLYLTGCQVEPVTYQTTPSPYVATTAAPYYGPRFDHDLSTLNAKGLMVESTATNIALWCRDLTNAAWSKTNVTAVKDQTGIDGVANAASLITATANGGTILLSVTLASSQRRQSAFVRRVTGSGAVEMTTDGGTTWTALALSGSWARQAIPAQTLANPSLGFRFATNGNAIAVDFVQNETGPDVTSPIQTGAAAVTRAAETANAALYSSQPAIIQYRNVSDGTRARKALATFSSISSESNIWIEQVAVYAPGTPSSVYNRFLTVDGPF